MPKDCPKSVVDAGRGLMKIRKLANKLSDAIDDEMPTIHSAIDEVVSLHRAKISQAGETLSLLREIQSSEGKAMQAHNLLRLVLNECDIEEPTNDQVASIR